MKELSLEEKAKRYDEAYKKVAVRFGFNVADEIFLEESEDERIRKGLIEACKQSLIVGGFHKDKVIAWLEKQGEQKPVDKDEPKFKVGDWISGYYTNYKISSVNNNGYVVEDVDGNKINILFENEKFHQLWTIQDAKDGDVLSFDNEGSNYHSIGIFKRIANKNELNGNTYRCYVRYGGFKKKLEIPINGDELHHCGTSAHPATKEQRDQLEKAMTDAGYKWDAEKKELKKIKQKPWSEEDESIMDAIYKFLDGSDALSVDQQQAKYWLKSLKDRIQPQPKQEWSEEDKKALKVVTEVFGQYGVHLLNYPAFIHWLKTLPNRITFNPYWKPSDEQLDALETAVSQRQSTALESL